MHKSTIGIIIVNWNTRQLTLDAIQSIYANDCEDQTVHIRVIDNGSTDDTGPAIRQRFPAVELIQNQTNLGFARATNQGLRVAPEEIIILMNSDTLLKTPATLETVRQFLDQQAEIGILGAKLVYADGSFQAAGRKFISLWELVKTQLLFTSAPIFKKLRHRLRVHRTPKFQFVDYVDGAFLAIRRQVIDEIGLLNENFYMYGEDMEWCARARHAGWKVAVHNEIEVIHFHAQSSKNNFEKMLFHNTKNNCQIMRHYHGEFQAKLAFLIYLAGMFLRIFSAFFRNRRQVTEYGHGLLNCWKNRREILGNIKLS